MVKIGVHYFIEVIAKLKRVSLFGPPCICCASKVCRVLRCYVYCMVFGVKIDWDGLI